MAVVNGGLETLLVPIAIAVDLGHASGFWYHPAVLCVDQSVDIIEVFCADTVDAGCDYRTRVFAPTFGYLEDPATGSGNSASGIIFCRAGSDGNALTLEQNGIRDRYNLVKLKNSAGRRWPHACPVCGWRVTRIDGKYILV